MIDLPHARELPDGSLVIPPATRTLLYRLLGDLSQTLAWTHGMQRQEPASAIENTTPGDEGTVVQHCGPVVLDHSRELEAIKVARELLLAGRAGRLPPLHQIMGAPPPRLKAPDLPDLPDLPDEPPPAGAPPLRRVK